MLADLSTVGASNPQGTLIVGHDGALYGTTEDGSGGGALQCGTLYRLASNGALTLLYSFDGPGGCDPSGNLALGLDGSLYGTTYLGGAFGAGTVFRLETNGTFTVLHSFQGGALGAGVWPRGGMTFGPDGNLYGTTLQGGQNGDGTVFRISATGADFEVLAIVGDPDAGLTVGADGFLYGSDRGHSGNLLGLPAALAGSLFRVSPSGGAEILYRLPFAPQPFPDPGLTPEGYLPMGELVEGPGGVFYGTAREGPGESISGGTVFRLEPSGSTWSLTLLHTFPPPDGNFLSPLGRGPEAGLTLGTDGNLYGTTISGGAGSNGTIYRVTPSGVFTSLHSFGGTGAVSNNTRLLEVSPGVFVGATQSGIFRLTVSNGNTAPVATNVAFSTNEDTATSGALTATDANGDAVTYAIVTNGSLGTATVTDAATGAFTFVPNADVNGTDTFTFRANDGTADSNVATVSVSVLPVNDAPVSQHGTASTFAGTPVNGVLGANDIDSTALTYEVVSQGARGTALVTNAATGAYTYTPAPEQSGSDTFTFRASDGSLPSNAATVTVTIAANRPPVAANSTLNTREDRSANGTISATDSDGNPLAFAILTNGTLGTATITNASTGRFSYVPRPNAFGTDTFTFSASDGVNQSAPATVTVTVTPVNDAPVATNSSVTTTLDTPVSGTAPATDVDSSTLTFSLSRAPRRGTVAVNIDGTFIYTPRAGYRGNDSFQFRVSDGIASSTGTVSIVVQ